MPKIDFSHTKYTPHNDIHPFFSIIIPVYNTEKYIARCLDSCINQTFQNIEIIIVDDFGQDSSMQIALNYAKKDKRIRIINNQKNLGLLHTRIIGEHEASGEYILHVDSDDWLDLNTCEYLYPYCIEKNFDIIGFDYTFNSMGIKQDKHKTISNPIGFLDKNIPNIMQTITLWGKTYKRTVVCEANAFIFLFFGQQIKKLVMGEDGIKLAIISLLSKKYYGIDKELYYYEQNPNSITAYSNNIEITNRKISDILFTISIFDKMDKYFSESDQKLAIKKIRDFYKSSLSLYKYHYYFSRAYENSNFAYPINFYKSLYHTKSPKMFCKTLVRIFVYFFTIGKIKI